MIEFRLDLSLQHDLTCQAQRRPSRRGRHLNSKKNTKQISAHDNIYDVMWWLSRVVLIRIDILIGLYLTASPLGLHCFMTIGLHYDIDE